MNIDRRITALESRDSGGLSASVRRWLGQPLTAADHREADRQDTEPLPPISDTAWMKLSRQAREWLGGQ